MAAPKLPRGSAQIVLWFRGLPQPTAFVTTEAEADKAMADFADRGEMIEFRSFPDGGGARSTTVVPVAELRALTIEVPTIQLMGVQS